MDAYAVSRLGKAGSDGILSAAVRRRDGGAPGGMPNLRSSLGYTAGGNSRNRRSPRRCSGGTYRYLECRNRLGDTQYLDREVDVV